MLRDGAPITFPRKAPGKPLALLKLIVAWGGKPTPQAEICDALWPQAEADVALDSLSVTVHRLRRLLGDPEAVKLQDGRLNIDTARCQVDAWAFESLLERAEEAARGGDAARMTRLCEERAQALRRAPVLAVCPSQALQWEAHGQALFDAAARLCPQRYWLAHHLPRSPPTSPHSLSRQRWARLVSNQRPFACKATAPRHG